MHPMKWPLVAAALALSVLPVAAQTPPPAIPVPPVGTAPPPAQPVSAAAAPPARPALPKPGAPAAPSPAPAGVAGLPPPPAAKVEPAVEPKGVRIVREDEIELPREEYRERLAACLSFSARCVPSGLTPQDRDYIRYELRGQRYAEPVVSEILSARMRQFTDENAPRVIVPKLAEGAKPGAVERLTTIENRGNVEGYGLAVTLAHPDARAAAPPRARRPARTGQGAVQDWW